MSNWIIVTGATGTVGYGLLKMVSQAGYSSVVLAHRGAKRTAHRETISNCHVVSSIVIGNGSFRNYTEMTISNNLALVSIELGESGFSQVHTVTFSSPSVSGLSHRLDFSPKHSSR